MRTRFMPAPGTVFDACKISVAAGFGSLPANPAAGRLRADPRTSVRARDTLPSKNDPLDQRVLSRKTRHLIFAVFAVFSTELLTQQSFATGFGISFAGNLRTKLEFRKTS